ncbi:MATE family efflux transporter [Paenibacillus sp. HN-1]|uniref:MATE family efflux transporter n=1 Tax=Paenibacillus TaxID=44249 RepID=UPI001CA9F0AB|nr:MULTISPECIES: MATE family efflux transporter [Paenibacillus]MBY9080121.1 MATE family efflux transporter [Paenibacillus sp. CGMCC 1.18879]MBY9083167.1 MATE family efflux transporter [Paenibacillus sinensis]
MEAEAENIKLQESTGLLLSQEKEGSLFSSIFKLAIPIVLQNLIISSLGFVDFLMIGGQGEASIAAVGLANQVYFIYTCILSSLCSGASIFTAQFWGKKDVQQVGRILGMVLSLCISIGAIFSLLSLFYSKGLIHLYSNDEKVVLMGGKFLFIIGISFVPTAITFCYSAILRSIEVVKMSMYISFFALSLNTTLNYLFINGLFGVPKLGITGVAIATCLSRFIEMLLLIFMVYFRKTQLSFKSLNQLFDFDFSLLNKFLRTAVPLLVGTLSWALGISVYHMIYARIGTDSIAAYNVASTIENLAFVFFIGLCGASNVIIGKNIGAEKPDVAYHLGKKIVLISFIGSIAVGLLIYVCSSPVLSLYDLSAAGLSNAVNILMVMSLLLWLKVINMTLIQGVLYGGGDTRFTLIQGIISMWLFGIPAAIIGQQGFHLPIYWIMVIAVFGEEMSRFIMGITRFISKKWINNLTNAV